MEVVANRLLNYSGHSGAKTNLSGKNSKIEKCLKTRANPEKRIAFSDSAAKVGHKSGETFQTHFKKYVFVAQCYLCTYI